MFFLTFRLSILMLISGLVHAFVHNNSKLFLTENQLRQARGENVTEKLQVQSKVIAITFGGKDDLKLPENITMTFKKIVPDDVTLEEGKVWKQDASRCAFWDTKLGNGQISYIFKKKFIPL